MAFRLVQRRFSSVSSPWLRTDRPKWVRIAGQFPNHDISKRLPPALFALSLFQVETQTRSIVEKRAKDVLQVCEKNDNILNAATPFPYAFLELQQKILKAPGDRTSVVYAQVKPEDVYAAQLKELESVDAQLESENGREKSKSWAETLWGCIQTYLPILSDHERKETMEDTRRETKAATEDARRISKIGSTRDHVNRNREAEQSYMLILCDLEYSLTKNEDQQVRNIVRNVTKDLIADKNVPFPLRYFFKTIQCKKDGGRGAGAYGYDKIAALNLLESGLQLEHGLKPEMEPFSCDLQAYNKLEEIVTKASNHLISTLQSHFDGTAPEISAAYTILTGSGKSGTCKCQAKTKVKPIQLCLAELIVGEERSVDIFRCDTCDGTVHSRLVQVVNEVKENPRRLVTLNTNDKYFDPMAGSDELAEDLKKQGFKQATQLFGSEIRLFCYPNGGAILLHAPFGVAQGVGVKNIKPYQWAERHITVRVLQSAAKVLKGDPLPIRNFENPLLGIYYAQHSTNGFHQHSSRASCAFREAVTPENVYAFSESSLKPAKGEIDAYPLFEGNRKGPKNCLDSVDNKIRRVVNALSFAVDESSADLAKEKIMSILGSKTTENMQNHKIMKLIKKTLKEGRSSQQCKDLLGVIESFKDHDY